MQFGHNSNVSVAGKTFHVQTEDRGVTHARIDTAVYFQGRVLHRRTNNYSDLLPLNADREQALKLRVDEQHRTILEEIRSGKLDLSETKSAKPKAAKSPSARQPQASPDHLLELLNAKTWLSGRRAFLQVLVRDQGRKPVQGAKVTARIEGGPQAAAFGAETGPFGNAELEFEMPQVTGPDVALVIESAKGTARGLLRFQLRAKPQGPKTV